MDPTVVYERLMRRYLLARGAVTRVVGWRGETLEMLELRGGGSLPPVMFMHGFSATGPTQWTTVVSRLLPHVSRILIPDLPGHGRSKLARPLSSEVMLEASRALLRDGLQPPAVVVASSMSGAIATRLASQHPEWVRGLALCSPGGAPLSASEIADLRNLFDVDSHKKALRFVDKVFARPPRTRAIIAWGSRRQLKRPHLAALLGQLEEQPWLTADELSGLPMPVMLLWGREDGVLPHSSYLFFKQNLPSGSRIERPDYGHAPFLEAPELLAESVLGFVRDVARRDVDRGASQLCSGSLSTANRHEERPVSAATAEQVLQ